MFNDGDSCELQDCFEKARAGMGLLPSEDETTYRVRKSPIESRIDEVDASVAALGRSVNGRVDSLADAMQQSLARLADKVGALTDMVEKGPSRARSEKRLPLRKNSAAPVAEATKSSAGKQHGEVRAPPAPPPPPPPPMPPQTAITTFTSPLEGSTPSREETRAE